MMNGILAIGDFFLTLLNGIGMIFLMFSARERAKIKERWNSSQRPTVILELTYGILGLVFVVAAVGYVVFSKP